ncbi:glycosyltransferase [Maridesulfovibrio sp.]|uniref:glycosyltransferase family 2 protein n=1 Tax=Maridesulfovibrio sp. TaxID=2795000 RepID=UPI0029CA3D42|nr:glycosyltransferase [Maridesulfovibrio sp.]
MCSGLSIIIPAYNMEKWLPVALESCLDQSDPDIEVIVVNDGSPDSCGEIAEYYAAQDSRVQAIHQENKGVGPSREAGQGLATKKYIHFLDADDLLTRHAVRDMVGLAEKDGVDLVCGNAVLFSDINMNTRRYFPHKAASGLRFAKSPSHWKSKVAWRWVMNTDFIRKHDFKHLPYKVGQDVLFMYQALTKVDRFSQCGSQFYYFRQDHKSVNMTLDTMFNHQFPHFVNAKQILMDAAMPGPLVKYLNENFFRDVKNIMPSLHGDNAHWRRQLIKSGFEIFEGLDPALFKEKIPEGAFVQEAAEPLFLAFIAGDEEKVNTELDRWVGGSGRKKNVEKNKGLHAIRRRIKSAFRPTSIKVRHRLRELEKRAADRRG